MVDGTRRHRNCGDDVVIILIAAERAAAEWSPIFSNVTEKSLHTLISFVFRPAKALCAFAGRLHYIAREPFFMSSRTRNAVKWRDLLASDRKRGDSSSQKLTRNDGRGRGFS